MDKIRIKAYGERYAYVKVKSKINRKKIFIFILFFAMIGAITVVILWASGI